MSKCQRCGTCCRELFLEIGGADLLREPRWRPYIGKFRDVDYRNWRANPDEVFWAVRQPGPCPFLRDNRCTIYATRPDACVAFRAVQDDRCAHNPAPFFDYATRTDVTTENTEVTENAP